MEQQYTKKELKNMSTIIQRLSDLEAQNSSLISSLNSLQTKVNELNINVYDLLSNYPIPIRPAPIDWDFGNFIIRIKANKNLIFTDIGVQIKTWFELNSLPIIMRDSIYLYCNEILDEHKQIIISLGNSVELETLIDGVITPYTI